MSDEIKTGDMVRLKSGGPTMMVSSVGAMVPGGSTMHVWCEWFDEQHKPQQKTFALTSVVKAG